MKALHGAAGQEVPASVDACMALLAAVEDYPSWYPDVVRRIEVLDTSGEGLATRVQATLHVAHGPVVRDFDLTMAVDVAPPTAVRLSRIADGPSDREEFAVAWRIEDRGSTWLGVELDANLAVPRLLPLGAVGEALARGFLLAAARALERSH
jgi:hypothetical protein